jgi:hypothetical protein
MTVPRSRPSEIRFPIDDSDWEDGSALDEANTNSQVATKRMRLDSVSVPPSSLSASHLSLDDLCPGHHPKCQPWQSELHTGPSLLCPFAPSHGALLPPLPPQEITLPDWGNYQNENKDLLFEKIKELSSHLQNFLLPLLSRWSSILSSAVRIERSFRDHHDLTFRRGGEGAGAMIPPQPSDPSAPYFYLSRYMNIAETAIESRMTEVNLLRTEIEDILKERCSLLLDQS